MSNPLFFNPNDPSRQRQEFSQNGGVNGGMGGGGMPPPMVPPTGMPPMHPASGMSPMHFQQPRPQQPQPPPGGMFIPPQPQQGQFVQQRLPPGGGGGLGSGEVGLGKRPAPGMMMGAGYNAYQQPPLVQQQQPQMQPPQPFPQQQSMSGQPPQQGGAALPQQLFPNFLGMSPDAQNLTQQMYTQVATQFLPDYGRRLFSENTQQVREFLKLPKSHFAVNNRYVLRKLLLVLCPFVNKSWQRRRSEDSGNFDAIGQSLPRDDINAPDLYIPVMALVTYVLLVGFISGTKGVFTPDKMAGTASVAIGVLTFEVLIIRLGFYLINARSGAWLDMVALGGYKFVGLVVSLLAGVVVNRVYYPVLIYCASMIALFLTRTYLRILLPGDHSGVGLTPTDVAKRNYFLLLIAVMQYPLSWILSVKP